MQHRTLPLTCLGLVCGLSLTSPYLLRAQSQPPDPGPGVRVACEDKNGNVIPCDDSSSSSGGSSRPKTWGETPEGKLWKKLTGKSKGQKFPEATVSDPQPAQPERVNPARKAAEPKTNTKRTDEQGFALKNADILNHLKGLDDNPSTSTGFNGAGESVRAPALSNVMPIYWRTVSVPAACMVADELKVGALCNVLDEIELMKILRSPDVAHELGKLLVEKGLKKTLVVSLGTRNITESRIDLVKAMYEAEVKMTDELYRAITREMTQDPSKQAWITQQAKLDAAAVKRLRQRIIMEKQANINASIAYLQSTPNTPGIRFNCSSACRQLIQAAKGIGELQ